jgi:hypothetical protein
MEVVNEEMRNILKDDSESEEEDNSLSDKKIAHDVKALEEQPVALASKPAPPQEIKVE